MGVSVVRECPPLKHGSNFSRGRMDLDVTESSTSSGENSFEQHLGDSEPLIIRMNKQATDVDVTRLLTRSGLIVLVRDEADYRSIADRDHDDASLQRHSCILADLLCFDDVRIASHAPYDAGMIVRPRSLSKGDLQCGGHARTLNVVGTRDDAVDRGKKRRKSSALGTDVSTD